jgi:hypothetical protein
MGAKAERRAARERVSAYHHAQLAGLLTHVAAAIDRYRADQIDAHALDETIHHYHRAAGELWKFCFARGGGSHPGVHRGPARPHGRRRRNHRLAGARHTAATPVMLSRTVVAPREDLLITARRAAVLLPRPAKIGEVGDCADQV